MSAPHAYTGFLPEAARGEVLTMMEALVGDTTGLYQEECQVLRFVENNCHKGARCSDRSSYCRC